MVDRSDPTMPDPSNRIRFLYPAVYYTTDFRSGHSRIIRSNRIYSPITNPILTKNYRSMKFLLLTNFVQQNFLRYDLVICPRIYVHVVFYVKHTTIFLPQCKTILCHYHLLQFFIQ